MSERDNTSEGETRDNTTSERETDRVRERDNE